MGEEVQGRVQCLTEDKARMATMIRRYSEKVDRDYEEKERIGIQCDVWRSKFLASRCVKSCTVVCGFVYGCVCALVYVLGFGSGYCGSVAL